MEVKEYDPLEYDNLAASVVRAMLDQPTQPLPPDKRFSGCGVYAIYYRGPFKAYQAIVRQGERIPIYVGKAIPSGGRKGGRADENGCNLWKRLAEHAESIKATKTLDVSDFCCRFLVVKRVWIPLAEQFLIRNFQPVWNVVVDGFGNHAPGSGRDSMIRPRWDTLHPGRTWAARLRETHTAEGILSDIRLHFK